MKEFTNPWHAAAASFIALFLVVLPPMLSYDFSNDYPIPATVFYRCDFSVITELPPVLKLGKAPTKTAMIRSCYIGLLTMG